MLCIQDYIRKLLLILYNNFKKFIIITFDHEPEFSLKKDFNDIYQTYAIFLKPKTDTYLIKVKFPLNIKRSSVISKDLPV